MIFFFDTETTGKPNNYKAPVHLVDNWPRMVQIAYYIYDINEQKQLEYSSYVIPDNYEIPLDAQKIHGITTAKAKSEGKDIKKILQKVQNDIARCKYIVAHNIEFDIKILGAEFIRYGLDNPLPEKISICTMKKSTNFCAIPGPYGGYKWPKLTELHYHLFNDPFNENHDAMADVTATVKCFWELRRKNILSLSKKIHKYNPNNLEIKQSENLIESRPKIWKDYKNILERYQNESNKTLPLAAQASAILHLKRKFQQIENNASVVEEFRFLSEYWNNDISNYVPNLTNEHALNVNQKRFIDEIQHSVILEHNNSSFFNNDKVKSLDDKILRFEALNLLWLGVIEKTDNKEKLNLGILIYFTFLDLYKNTFSKEQIEKLEFSKDENMEENNYSIKKTVIAFFNKIDDISNVSFPFELYRLLNKCNSELQQIKKERSATNKEYIEDTDYLVRIITTNLFLWIKNNNVEIILLNIEGLEFGNNLLEAASKLMDKISTIDMENETRKWFENQEKEFKGFKAEIQPKSGCFIATLAYGNYDHPQVIKLRNVRDVYLLQSYFGKCFVIYYYKYSPNLVKLLKEKQLIIKLIRSFLDFIIKVISTFTKRI